MPKNGKPRVFLHLHAYACGDSSISSSIHSRVHSPPHQQLLVPPFLLAGPSAASGRRRRAFRPLPRGSCRGCAAGGRATSQPCPRRRGLPWSPCTALPSLPCWPLSWEAPGWGSPILLQQQAPVSSRAFGAVRARAGGSESYPPTPHTLSPRSPVDGVAARDGFGNPVDWFFVIKLPVGSFSPDEIASINEQVRAVMSPLVHVHVARGLLNSNKISSSIPTQLGQTTRVHAQPHRPPASPLPHPPPGLRRIEPRPLGQALRMCRPVVRRHRGDPRQWRGSRRGALLPVRRLQQRDPQLLHGPRLRLPRAGW